MGDGGGFVEIFDSEPVVPIEGADGEAVDVNGLQGRVTGSHPDGTVVETFSGKLVAIPQDKLREFKPAPGENGGFDAAWPHSEEESSGVAWQVTESLVTKGFCVVQCVMSDQERENASDAAKELPNYHRMMAETENAYLGRKAFGKVAWLEEDSPSKEVTNTLEYCDRVLTEMAVMLTPLSQDAFGFGAWGRSDGLVRSAFDDAEDEERIEAAREKLDDIQVQLWGVLEDHVKFIQQRKICMLYFVGANGGYLTLHEKDGTDVNIPIEHGRIVVFRHDLLSYTFTPMGESLALQAWVLTEPYETKMTAFQGTEFSLDQAMGLMAGPTNPIYGQTGKSVSIMAMHTLIPGNGASTDMVWNFLVAGCDCCRHLSSVRWDYEPYYESNKDLAIGKYYSNHGGFVLEEDMWSFDNTFFGIDDQMAMMLDPLYRNALEIGFETLIKAGMSKKKMNGANIGVFQGNCGTDWPGILENIVRDENSWALKSTGVCNGRLSFMLGMRGPISTSDTACSSSLVATGVAHNMLRVVEPDQNKASHGTEGGLNECLVQGLNALLGPFSWIGLCGPHMLSPTGRCFTFDHSADGFSRGEGFSGAFLKVTDGEPSDRLAMLCGSCVNQDGRSASMTAPHGPSQQECIKASLREANLNPNDVRIAELHGTGTALGDPIEVGALRGVMKNRDSPILKTSAKSNLAHGEANAGLAGFVKCAMMMVHGTSPPNVHLISANPHIDMTGYPVYIADEMTDLGTNSGYAGVCSFGFGGTNGRADLWARASVGVRAATELDDRKLDFKLVRCPKCLGWMEHVSGTAFGAMPAKPPGGRWVCDSLRDEWDTYEHCSSCYTGEYQYGAAPVENPLPAGRMFIIGSWDTFSSQSEMQGPDPQGQYHFYFRLGETRVEQFRMLMEQNELYSVQPCAQRADMTVRVVGPAPLKKGFCWMIDGRDDDWKSGSTIHITLRTAEGTNTRFVEWEKLDDDAGSPSPSPFQHSYFVQGSWTAGQPIRMQRVSPTVFEYAVRIGTSGQESFSLMRDQDPEQMIYPVKDMTQRRGVPVRGPDHLGRGKHWVVFGEASDKIMLRLSINDGHIVVTASGPRESKMWESVDGPGRHCFSVRSTWAPKCEPMRKARGASGVYTLTMQITDKGFEEFQILVDDDEMKAYHPDVAGAAVSGEAFVEGPDADGEDKAFRIEGTPGTEWEITLNLKPGDRRRVVTWRMLAWEDGSAFLPLEAKFLPLTN